MRSILFGCAVMLLLVVVAGTVAAAERNNAEHPIYKQSLEDLTAQALVELDAAVEGIKAWVDKVRPRDGSRGRFRWALDAKHPPTFPSTAYILEGLEYVGIFDQVITEQDRKQGIAWIRSTRRKDGTYHDPHIPLNLTNRLLTRICARVWAPGDSRGNGTAP